MKTTPETKTLNAITKFYAKRLRMPTYSEIAELIGVSSKESAHRQVQKLIDAKLLRKDKQGKLLPPKSLETKTVSLERDNNSASVIPNLFQDPAISKSLQMHNLETSSWGQAGVQNRHGKNNSLVKNYEELAIPMLGLVEAGLPSEAEQQDLDMISLNEWLVRSPESSFVLEVKGESMIEAGIHNGDHVIADTRKTARIGDIVIARLDGGVTMKYLRQKGNLLYLEPANKYLDDMYPQSELSVQAVVTAVIRKFR